MLNGWSPDDYVEKSVSHRPYAHGLHLLKILEHTRIGEGTHNESRLILVMPLAEGCCVNLLRSADTVRPSIQDVASAEVHQRLQASQMCQIGDLGPRSKGHKLLTLTNVMAERVFKYGRVWTSVFIDFSS